MPAPTTAPDTTPRATLDRIHSSLPLPLRRKLRRARDLPAPQSSEKLPTAVAAIDRLLPGGLPRGQLVELIGRHSSGRFSLLLSVLAAVTGAGDCAALVDLGDGLDTRAAARAGVHLERLLWLRPQHMRTALAGTEILLRCGFPLVVFDLGLPPIRGGRGAEPAWLRLARTATVQSSAVLVSSPYRASGTAATAVLETGEALPLWHGGSHRLLTGLSCRMRINKLRGSSASDKVDTFRLLAPETAATRLVEATREERVAPGPSQATATAGSW